MSQQFQAHLFQGVNYLILGPGPQPRPLQPMPLEHFDLGPFTKLNWQPGPPPEGFSRRGKLGSTAIMLLAQQQRDGSQHPVLVGTYEDAPNVNTTHAYYQEWLPSQPGFTAVAHVVIPYNVGPYNAPLWDPIHGAFEQSVRWSL